MVSLSAADKIIPPVGGSEPFRVIAPCTREQEE